MLLCAYLIRAVLSAGLEARLLRQRGKNCQEAKAITKWICHGLKAGLEKGCVSKVLLGLCKLAAVTASTDDLYACLQFIFGVADKHDPRLVLEEVHLCLACYMS